MSSFIYGENNLKSWKFSMYNAKSKPTSLFCGTSKGLTEYVIARWKSFDLKQTCMKKFHYKANKKDPQTGSRMMLGLNKYLLTKKNAWEKNCLPSKQLYVQANNRDIGKRGKISSKFCCLYCWLWTYPTPFSSVGGLTLPW